MSKKNPKTLTCWINNEINQLLNSYCQAEEMSRSQVVRKAVKHYIREKEGYKNGGENGRSQASQTT